VTRTEQFDQALVAIRAGAHVSLCGLTLAVNGVAMAITDSQFDVVWALMDELDGVGEDVISIA
jgi:hypothetical protein